MTPTKWNRRDDLRLKNADRALINIPRSVIFFVSSVLVLLCTYDLKSMFDQKAFEYIGMTSGIILYGY